MCTFFKKIAIVFPSSLRQSDRHLHLDFGGLEGEYMGSQEARGWTLSTTLLDNVGQSSPSS